MRIPLLPLFALCTTLLCTGQRSTDKATILSEKSGAQKSLEKTIRACTVLQTWQEDLCESPLLQVDYGDLSELDSATFIVDNCNADEYLADYYSQASGFVVTRNDTLGYLVHTRGLVYDSCAHYKAYSKEIIGYYPYNNNPNCLVYQSTTTMIYLNNNKADIFEKHETRSIGCTDETNQKTFTVFN
jgi:hypothetical protein